MYVGLYVHCDVTMRFQQETSNKKNQAENEITNKT